EEIEEQDTSITQLSFRNSIEIINLSFSYPNTNQKALDTINLCILKGEKIGIIGKSGSGKSSLVDVLLRLQDNYSGKILLDGSDIRSLPLTPYRRLFGVVSQESILFNDAIKDNITLNTPYDIERMAQVLQVANLDELISQKDEGIHYTIGERGGLLSGGERQRLTIARALYQNPPILLLDEATNALDAQSEGIVKEALYKALENRTALIIAHNLSLLSEVDRVLVLEDGKIIKEGSYNEILDSVN
ncbi:MAG TPA: ATP-binding cassette domain-containing protein, partial [Saprospiraceae bacterium]|nr:ATP-binding cassette domain-containing protein [Saprospiraceae bacterium]